MPKEILSINNWQTNLSKVRLRYGGWVTSAGIVKGDLATALQTEEAFQMRQLTTSLEKRLNEVLKAWAVVKIKPGAFMASNGQIYTNQNEAANANEILQSKGTQLQNFSLQMLNKEFQSKYPSYTTAYNAYGQIFDRNFLGQLETNLKNAKHFSQVKQVRPKDFAELIKNIDVYQRDFKDIKGKHHQTLNQALDATRKAIQDDMLIVDSTLQSKIRTYNNAHAFANYKDYLLQINNDILSVMQNYGVVKNPKPYYSGYIALDGKTYKTVNEAEQVAMLMKYQRIKPSGLNMLQGSNIGFNTTWSERIQADFKRFWETNVTLEVRNPADTFTIPDDLKEVFEREIKLVQKNPYGTGYRHAYQGYIRNEAPDIFAAIRAKLALMH